jgi:hypothetical protein
MYFTLHLFSVVLIVIFVLVALMPQRARYVLEFLGLCPLIAAIDGKRLQAMIRWLGQFILLMALVMLLSIWFGYNNTSWYIPVVQATFFGGILVWIASLKKVDNDE